MTFDYENQMAEPAERWMRKQKLMVKKEFPTPWGICDLVGCTFDKRNARKRWKLDQAGAIGSPLGIEILFSIPDGADGKAVTLEALHVELGGSIRRSELAHEVEKLIKDGFVCQTQGNMLQKLNGWMPLQRKLMALELKLSRVSEALHQAANNLEFADESFVGLPMKRARMVLASNRRKEFLDRGIGMVGVSRGGCRMLLKPDPEKSRRSAVLSAYFVERFWRTYAKGSSA